MQESEAKEKICHRQFNARQADDGIYEHGYCIGSDCMAWRWNGTMREVEAGTPGAVEFAAHPHRWFVLPTDGRCGLAGDSVES